MNLLHLGDQDIPPILKNNYINSDYRILSEQSRIFKSNTTTLHHSYNCTGKVKTEGELSVERTANSTQNKENLKRIL
jgi:hypothetical protein